MARGQGLNSEIMAGADRLDPPRLGGTRRNGPDMNDLFAFFPRDLCPVVRVRGVWQILVLLEFFPDRPEQIIGFDAFRLGRDDPINGVFLRPRVSPPDLCAACYILELETLL